MYPIYSQNSPFFKDVFYFQKTADCFMYHVHWINSMNSLSAAHTTVQWTESWNYYWEKELRLVLAPQTSLLSSSEK